MIRHPLMYGVPPSWADGWGEDERGPFVEVAFGDDRREVRLRWIPVETERGFWLLETEGTEAERDALAGVLSVAPGTLAREPSPLEAQRCSSELTPPEGFVRLAVFQAGWA